jgi:type IV pilus assembly protein PilC
MASYQCKVGTLDGTLQNIVAEGRNIDEASRKMQEQGYFILDIQEISAFKSSGKSLLTSRSFFSEKDLISFTRQLSSLLKSGLSLIESVSLLANENKNPRVEVFYNSLLNDLRSGLDFSDSIAKFPDTFQSIYLQSVYAGEKSGSYTEVLDRLGDHYERSRRLRSSVIQSMIYPAILFGIASMIFLYMIFSVIPKFGDVLKDMGDSLPFYTSILLDTSAFIKEKIILILVIVFALGFELREWIRSSSGKSYFDNKIINTPFLGRLVLEYNLVSICRTLSTLITGGVSLLEALKIISVSINNQKVYSDFSKLIPHVESGGSFSEGLKRHSGFPEMASKMVKVGEETGSLSLMLMNTAEYYDKELTEKIITVTSVLEPLMLVFTALITGGIVISLFLPVIQMSMSVKF